MFFYKEKVFKCCPFLYHEYRAFILVIQILEPLCLDKRQKNNIMVPFLEIIRNSVTTPLLKKTSYLG